MKKKTKICFVIGAAVAALFLVVETRRKQKKAKETGKHVPHGVYEAVLKRPLDVVITAMALVVLLPVMGIIAVLVRVKLGSPVLFKQERPGLDERIFTLYKFRTMTDERDENGELLPDEKRLTKFGKWLRSTSLDELPELFNILKGDMSLVGPRPLLVEYLPRYSDRQRHRHDVRPGLTGLAQVSGRNDITWAKKIDDDIQYVEHITFVQDMKIVFRTISVVLRHDGIRIDCPEFTGTEADEWS